MSRHLLSDPLVRLHHQPQFPLRRCHEAHSHYCRALRIEPLEDRKVLATFLVNTMADTIDTDPNVTSLREAIQAANDVVNYADADVIQFAACLHGTIMLDSAMGQLGITDDLTITGPGARRLAISGNDAVRVFYVTPATTGTEITVNITGLTIAHGRAANGGGIWSVGGTLNLDHVVLSNNQAVGVPGQTARGGAIANASNATLTVSHSTFSANQAVGGDSTSSIPAGGAFGGAIDNLNSNLSLSHSILVGNLAVGGTGSSGRLGGAANGGGIHSTGSAGSIAMVDVADSTFKDNQALGGDGGGSGFGGAIQQLAFSQLSVTNSIFRGNQVRGGNDGVGGSGSNVVLGQAGGGAIRNMGTSSTSNIAGSQFYNNQATGGDNNTGSVGTFTQPGNGLGGAIVQGLGSLAVFDSVFVGNQALGGAANGGGGADLNIVGGGFGGAICLTRIEGSITVENSSFIDNRALGGNGNLPGTGSTNSVGDGAGGAIENANGGPIAVTSSWLIHNQAIGGAGAPGYSGGDAYGGGIAVAFYPQYIQNAGNVFGGKLNVTNSMLVMNQALGGRGGSGANGGNALGGALYIQPNFLQPETATLTGNMLIANRAIGGTGSSGGQGGNGRGGGLYNLGKTELVDTVIVANKTKGGAAGSGGLVGTGVGGGVYNDIDNGATISIDDVDLIFANMADEFDDIFGYSL